MIGWLVGFYSSRFVRCFYYYPAQRKIRKFLANFFAGFSVARGKPIATKRRRNEAPPNQKEKKNMKTKVLLLGAVVTAFTFTSFAADALLSPRAQANQITIVKGVVNERNPYLECRNTMTGSPKAAGACSEHPAMPGCVTVAPLK